MFWACFTPFCNCTKVGAKRDELVPLTHKLRQNFSQQTHPIHSTGPKTHVLGRFVPFRYRTKVGAKRDEPVPLAHKFAK
jgi:hypothetical protein